MYINPTPLAITPESLPDGNQGQVYPPQSIVISGGNPPYNIQSTGALPPNLEFTNPQNDTLILQGTVAEGTSGEYPFQINVTDSTGQTLDKNY